MGIISKIITLAIILVVVYAFMLVKGDNDTGATAQVIKDTSGVIGATASEVNNIAEKTGLKSWIKGKLIDVLDKTKEKLEEPSINDSSEE